MRERGLKCLHRLIKLQASAVAPVRERGLKFAHSDAYLIIYGRSREGAWIEIKACINLLILSPVAPVRERGLKCAVRIAQAKAHLASLP